MSESEKENQSLSRRRFLAVSGGMFAAAGLDARASADTPATNKGPVRGANLGATEPFWGKHQSGILTPAQSHTYFAALDLVATQREDIIGMLRAWTSAAAQMADGQTAEPMGQDPSVPGPDSGEALGLPPARLTVTFGFGAGLFTKDGQDRYGLAARRPAVLIDLPKFNGDQLVEARTGGDLLVQACADDPQTAFHAVRQLVRLAYDVAEVRWVQAGFIANAAAKQTPRNLMGFKDGTNNPATSDSKAMDKVVWVGSEGPEWMRQGSYVVVRRIRMALEHWDRMNLGFQEQTIGRHKESGAPIGGKSEFDTPDYNAVDKDGGPIITENAHIRLGAPVNNEGAQILRRPYSYNDGADLVTERWPPWRQGMEYDAGLLFVCYQSDPRTGFVKVFDKMSKFDALNQFVTHTGGGLFACPGGVAKGEFIGQRLFENGGVKS
jgi:deferrochelatase/peroxidase EfeB